VLYEVANPDVSVLQWAVAEHRAASPSAIRLSHVFWKAAVSNPAVARVCRDFPRVDSGCLLPIWPAWTKAFRCRDSPVVPHLLGVGVYFCAHRTDEIREVSTARKVHWAAPRRV